MRIKIILADDHQIVREGLRSLLKKQPDLHVIGEADNGNQAVLLSRKLKPDIVVIDVRMKDTNGIDATRRITKYSPDIRVIALSMYLNKAFVTEMLKAGASAYILKERAFAELLKAIKAVSRGQIYLCSYVEKMLVDEYVNDVVGRQDRPYPHLTDREVDVLKMLADGNCSKEIASKLEISTKTVDASRRRIMKKLNLDNMAALVKYAVTQGLTQLDDYGKRG